MPAALPLPFLAASTHPAPPPARPFRAGRRALTTRCTWWLLALLVLLGGTAPRAFAQAPAPGCSQDEKFINIWYFGYKAGLDFNQATDSIPPTVLTNGQMVAPAGSGVMADGNGALLFYSNGDTVWNRNHAVMLNGTGLGGNRLVTDGPLAIKKPGSPDPNNPGGPTHYYLFTQDAAGGPKGLSYSEIEIPAGAGQPGQVLASNKNTHLAYGTAEKMTAVFDKNGCDIWVIVHGYGTPTGGPSTDNRGDAFLAYHVTTAGVVAQPVISAIGLPHTPASSPFGYRGQMKVSPDGQQLAVARYSEVTGDSTGTVELFAFDASTGVVSNRRLIDYGAGRYYGVEFSPGRSRLYATVNNPPQLLQFDLSATNVPASKQVIPLKQKTPANLGSLQAAPDGKVYVARDNQPALGFITYPDSLGAKARYADDSLTLQLGGRRSGLGLPNFNQSSLLRVGFGAQSTACGEITFQAGSPVPNPESYSWTYRTTGGTVLGSSSLANPKFTFPVAQYYDITLRITNFCFCREVTSRIFVPGPPTPGSIAANQTLCVGGTPAPLASTAPAGAGTGEFSYQWQSSVDNTNWQTINGATGLGYAPGALTRTTYFRRLVTSGFCAPNTPTAAVTITVLPALVAGSIGASQSICTGSTPALLTSTAAASGGSGTFAYQWEASLDNTTWANAAGASTGATYAPGALTATTYFRRRVTSGPCAEVSNVVTIMVQPALAPGTIAASQSLCAGATAAPLTSPAPATGGTGAIAYQWEYSTDNTNWQPITNATGPTYAPGALAATTSFRRRASSSSTCGPAVSNVVTITVTPLLVAGSIGADQRICVGSSPAALTSTAPATGGSGAITYQWEASLDNTTWAAAAGASTGATYAPGALTATTYFRRRASAGGACGPVVSNVVTITVLPVLTPGSIAASQSICAGSAANALTSTSAAAGIAGPISYQWEASTDNATWAPAGGTSTDEAYSPGVLNATTYFRRRASNGNACGPVVSNVVTISVAPALAAGTIGTDQTLCPGAAAAPLTSTTGASGGTGSYSYQWESSADLATWTVVPGATGATYAPGVLPATTYFRRRVSSGPCGPAYSSFVTLRVLSAVDAGTIAASQTICAGTAPSALVSTNIASGGIGRYDYQWEISTNNVNWAAIPGATGTGYAPGALTATTYYRRRVTSGTATCSTVVSNVVTIQVQPLVTPTVALATPPVQCAGTALTFTAATTNVGAAPTFRWFVNGAAVASGPTFTSSTLATGDQVRVEVTPTPGLCSTGPASATVTVTRTEVRQPTLAIAVQPGGPVCLGEPLTFSIATVTDAGPAPQYQWQVNGSDVAGATTPVFTSTTLRAGQTVTLRLRTTNACGQAVAATSNGVGVRIQPPVVVSAGPDKEILQGGSVVLEGSVENNAPVTWAPTTGLTFPGPDQLRPLASPAVTTTYTISAGAGGCASSDEVTVTVRPPIRIPNAFTPNGDGRDDTWQIEFIEQFPDNTVSVFNRWGNRIFSAENYSRANEWRGDINGQPAPVGTYYYVVVTKGPLGRSYSGSITVLY